MATRGDLAAFQARVDAVVHEHPVVVDNQYTRWFAKGEATLDEVRHLTVQFSVFSQLFVEAQLRKVLNAGLVLTALVVASHDPDFLEAVGITRVIEFKPGEPPLERLVNGAR